MHKNLNKDKKSICYKILRLIGTMNWLIFEEDIAYTLRARFQRLVQMLLIPSHCHILIMIYYLITERIWREKHEITIKKL